MNAAIRALDMSIAALKGVLSTLGGLGLVLTEEYRKTENQLSALLNEREALTFP